MRWWSKRISMAIAKAASRSVAFKAARLGDLIFERQSETLVFRKNAFQTLLLELRFSCDILNRFLTNSNTTLDASLQDFFSSSWFDLTKLGVPVFHNLVVDKCPLLMREVSTPSYTAHLIASQDVYRQRRLTLTEPWNTHTQHFTLIQRIWWTITSFNERSSASSSEGELYLLFLGGRGAY